VPRISRSRQLLDALVDGREVVSIEPLSIGWPGRGSGSYRDDDGTHARVVLGDGTSVIFREYAQTNEMVEAYQQKEAHVFDLLRDAGLPTPRLLASMPGGALLTDPGGEPLEVLRSDDVWGEVGTMLRRLHAVDVADDLWLGDRPWMDPIPYLIRNLRRRVGPVPKDLIDVLRGPVAEHLARRPRSICCGGYSLPGLMIDGGRTTSWLSLGYYVSIGDPDRDVVGIGGHHPLPDAFYAAYGRRPDPIAAVVYDLVHTRFTGELDEVRARLRDVLL
jgi:hypothetical protein